MAVKKNISKLRAQPYYWKYNLQTKSIFINKNNINELISEQNFISDIGLMHIDLDGNDYYIWKSITVVKPIIVIVEYNAIFGIDRPISVIYSDTFNRSNAHYSNLLFDSSLRSLVNLASEKGYSFIGCNIAGNNVYFIRNDKLNDDIKPVSLSHGYIASKYRESRDKNGVLTYLSKEDSMALLPGMSVFNTDLNCVEPF